MKALTLWQPWATLIAIGAKRVETRPWATKHRGPLAIHAAASIPKEARWAMIPGPGFGPKPIYRALTDAGYRVVADRRRVRHDLPTGVVVATARLVDCVPVGELQWPDGDTQAEDDGWYQRADGVTWVREDQRAFGDFSAGRFAWLLEDVERFEIPRRAKGRQGLWNWDSS